MNLKIRPDSVWHAAASLIGIAAFYWIMGPEILRPSNIGWLQNVDQMMHYLGLAYFLNSPWQFPVGLNSNYGLDIPSSIVYSDSIPILALVTKLLGSFLSHPFQYFGFWILLSYTLQGLLGYQLTHLLVANRWLSLAGAFLFVFSPPFIARTDQHITLSAHFLILSALYLNLRKNKRYQDALWIALILLSVTVHPYLFVMVGGLCVADYLKRVFDDRTIDLKRMIAIFIITCAFVTLVAWQCGYFVMDAEKAFGFGKFQLNAFSLIDANKFSYILPDIKTSSDPNEGFAYLGLGLMILLPLAIISGIKLRCLLYTHCAQHKYLIGILIIFTIFSFSNVVSFGTIAFEYPLPEWLTEKASNFRASGRFFWPIYYCIVLIMLYLVSKQFHNKKYGISLILLAVCAIQFFDTRSGWNGIREKNLYSKSKLVISDLKSPFWNIACTHYKNLMVIPLLPSPTQYKWADLAPYALRCEMATNSVYLTRQPNSEIIKSNNSYYQELVSNAKFNPETLYVFNGWKVAQIFQNPKHNTKLDLLAIIDGINVLAPGWHQFNINHQIVGMSVEYFYPQVITGKKILFNTESGNSERYLNQIGYYHIDQGWAHPESWGVWSNGHQSSMDLWVPSDHPKVLQMDFRAFVTPTHPVQQVKLIVNGIEYGSFRFDNPVTNQIKISIPSDLRILHLDFVLPDAIAPSKLGLGSDQRKLAIGLKNVVFLH